MLTRAQKEEQVTELKDVFARANCVYVADYRGLDVTSVNELRKRIHREGEGEYQYQVRKNTLLLRASKGSPAECLADLLAGPTAVAISFGDPVGLAKILEEFAKDHEVFEIKGGMLEGQPVSRAEIATLATLPSLDAIRGQLVGLVQAPATKLVRLLSEPGSQLARLIEARRAQQAGAEGAS